MDSFKFINGLHLELGYKYYTVIYEKENGEKEKAEFFVENENIKKLYNFDITSQTNADE